MRNVILALAALFPAPVMAAELWCMPETLCRPDGTCKSTTDAETSLRIADLTGKETTMRAHAETISIKQTKAGSAVEWRGSNERSGKEYMIWSTTTNAFTYTVMDQTGDVWKSTGLCEVQ